jgi:hypothetical protein
MFKKRSGFDGEGFKVSDILNPNLKSKKKKRRDFIICDIYPAFKE